MKKANKTLILFIAVLILAFSPLAIIKTFNIDKKGGTSTTTQSNFSPVDLITRLDGEKRKMLAVIVEASLIGGVAGFFIGYFLTKTGKKKTAVENETVCPVCKEKFIKKIYK
jgi:hypothetical protein